MLVAPLGDLSQWRSEYCRLVDLRGVEDSERTGHWRCSKGDEVVDRGGVTLATLISQRLGMSKTACKVQI